MYEKQLGYSENPLSSFKVQHQTLRSLYSKKQKSNMGNHCVSSCNTSSCGARNQIVVDDNESILTQTVPCTPEAKLITKETHTLSVPTLNDPSGRPKTPPKSSNFKRNINKLIKIDEKLTSGDVDCGGEESENIQHKSIEIVNGDEHDRLIIIEDVVEKQDRDAKVVVQPKEENIMGRASVNQKVRIAVDWGSFIKLKQKNFINSYRIIRELGRGGYGVVYRVQMKSSDTQRAMKSIKKSSLFKEDEKKIFMEMAILKEMDHPNIIKLLQIYDWQNYYYLITQYCDGGDLFEYLREKHRFSEKSAASIMKQLLSPVVYMHKKGVVHRDLKPENLMFVAKENNPVLKIIDFGTSNRIKPGKTLSKEIGTPYYVAPEVLNRCYNEKCDVWSCGIILYMMLCGYPPFRGDNQKAILMKVIHDPLYFDPVHWDGISADAIMLIKGMLEKNPTKRMTALEALNSIWINTTCSELPLQNEVLENLKNFHFKNKFKAVVLTYIASQLFSNRDKKELHRIFEEIDTDNDGVIEREELLNAYRNNYEGHLSTDVSNILKIVDINGSGKIDYTEFLVAASSEEKLVNAARLDDAFAFFDTDHSGSINIEEIRKFLADQTEEQIKDFFNEFDFNRDGKISKDEFKQLLLQQSNKLTG